MDEKQKQNFLNECREIDLGNTEKISEHKSLNDFIRYHVEWKKITADELKNMKLKFEPVKNQYWIWTLIIGGVVIIIIAMIIF